MGRESGQGSARCPTHKAAVTVSRGWGLTPRLPCRRTPFKPLRLAGSFPCSRRTRGHPPLLATGLPRRCQGSRVLHGASRLTQAKVRSTPGPAHTHSEGLSRKCRSEPGWPGANVSLGWSAVRWGALSSVQCWADVHSCLTVRESAVAVPLRSEQPHSARPPGLLQRARDSSKAASSSVCSLSLSVSAQAPLPLPCSQPISEATFCACPCPVCLWRPTLSPPRLPDPLPFLALPPHPRTPLCRSFGLRP